MAMKCADAAGEAWVQELRPGVVSVGLVGYVTERIARRLLPEVERVLGGDAPLRLFVDLERLAAYDPEVRDAVRRVLGAVPGRIDALLPPRVVVAGFGEAAPELRVHHERASFERALGEV